jgi:predicted dehydrogenase
MDYVRDPDKRTLELVGDKASVEFYLNEGIIRYYRKNRKGYEESIIPFIRDELFIRQIDNFIGMIKGEQEPEISLQEGIETLRVAEAAIKSCRERRFVNV